MSLELTNGGIVDGRHRLAHESRVGSDPEIIATELLHIRESFVRVGFEAEGCFLGLKYARSLGSVHRGPLRRVGDSGKDGNPQLVLCIGAVLDGLTSMMAGLSVLHRELLRVPAMTKSAVTS